MENIVLLNISVWLPLISVCVILGGWKFIDEKIAKSIALFSTAIPALTSLLLWWNYSSNVGEWAYERLISFAGISLPTMGLNAISLAMFVLAGVVGFVAVLWACINKIERIKLYLVLLLVMQGGLLGAFATTNILWMYMFHEFALIPTFIAMLIWGGAGKNIAAMQMAIYLTLGALIALVGVIMIIIFSGGIMDITLLSEVDFSLKSQNFIWAFLMFGLGTLVSIFPFYSWAPKTYAAAPTSFAMLHSGVLKKFGLYFLIQVGLLVAPSGLKDWAWILAVLALGNVIYVGMLTMAQRDLKLMISYSSVAHMGLCFLGIASMSVLGVSGAVMMMFAHGFTVALMFMLCNSIMNKTSQWDMFKMGGLYKLAPNLSGLFVLASFAGVGLPCFANFWGELTILTSLWSFNKTICILAGTGIIISAIYALRAIARVLMGTPNSEYGKITDLKNLEKLAALILLVMILFVGFWPKSITNALDNDVALILSANNK